MFRTMYDGITPSRLPGDGALYASYVDGHWPNFSEVVHRFPNKVHVSIAVDPRHRAMVLDVEKYDATPEQAPAWATMMRRARQIPTIYCSESLWPAVKRAFHVQEVAAPLYWIANYDRDGSELPAGAVALQFHSTDAFDRSIVAPHWPGVDPSPAPHPHPPVHKPNRVHHVVRAGDNLSDIAAHWSVSLTALEHANPHAGHPAGNFARIFPGDVIYRP